MQIKDKIGADETERIKKTIDDLFKEGFLTRGTRSMLVNALAISGESFVKAIACVISNLTLEIAEREKIESTPELVSIITNTVRMQALVNHECESLANINEEEEVKILKICLTLMAVEATYGVSIVLGPMSYQMLVSFFTSKISPDSAVMIRIKNIYIPDIPEPREEVYKFLNMLKRNHKVKLFHGADKVKEFTESSKGTFILIEDAIYGTEGNSLIVESIRKGSIVVCRQGLNFDLDGNQLDWAAEDSPIEEGKMVMINQGDPLIKSSIFPLFFQLGCCGFNREIESSMILID